MEDEKEGMKRKEKLGGKESEVDREEEKEKVQFENPHEEFEEVEAGKEDEEYVDDETPVEDDDAEYLEDPEELDIRLDKERKLKKKREKAEKKKRGAEEMRLLEASLDVDELLSKKATTSITNMSEDEINRVALDKAAAIATKAREKAGRGRTKKVRDEADISSDDYVPDSPIRHAKRVILREKRKAGDEELIIEGWEAARMGYEEDSDMEYRPNTQPKSKRGRGRKRGGAVGGRGRGRGGARTPGRGRKTRTRSPEAFRTTRSQSRDPQSDDVTISTSFEAEHHDPVPYDVYDYLHGEDAWDYLGGDLDMTMPIVSMAAPRNPGFSTRSESWSLSQWTMNSLNSPDSNHCIFYPSLECLRSIPLEMPFLLFVGDVSFVNGAYSVPLAFRLIAIQGPEPNKSEDGEWRSSVARFKLSVQIERRGSDVTVPDIAGTIGRSVREVIRADEVKILTSLKRRAAPVTLPAKHIKLISPTVPSAIPAHFEQTHSYPSSDKSREYKEFFLLYRSSDYHAPAVMGCSGRPIGNCDPAVLSTMQCEDVGMSILALLDLASHASSLDKPLITPSFTVSIPFPDFQFKTLHVPSLYENHDMLFVPFPMQHDVESLFSGVPTLDSKASHLAVSVPCEALLSLSKAGSAVKLHLAVDMAIFDNPSLSTSEAQLKPWAKALLTSISDLAELRPISGPEMKNAVDACNASVPGCLDAAMLNIPFTTLSERFPVERSGELAFPSQGFSQEYYSTLFSTALVTPSSPLAKEPWAIVVDPDSPTIYDDASWAASAIIQAHTAFFSSDNLNAARKSVRDIVSFPANIESL
eukprot:TRINITY_DN1507_c0_g1_i1.p1 TRINITY_DN1507_c0_g1~~TRINITY_DN1507_c0_g1_i1.p1  ORF type:complete len:849 (-),score=212.54 TRINITY_DN1507_c0_g1_i1:101-2536(-)